MSETLQERIEAALRRVRNARTGTDVVAGEMVRDIATTVEGRVRLTLLLAPEDDATLVRAVRTAIEGVAGVADVRVDVKDPAELAPRAAAAPTHAAPAAPAAPRQGRALPTLEPPRPQGGAPARP